MTLCCLPPWNHECDEHALSRSAPNSPGCSPTLWSHHGRSTCRSCTQMILSHTKCNSTFSASQSSFVTRINLNTRIMLGLWHCDVNSGLDMYCLHTSPTLFHLISSHLFHISFPSLSHFFLILRAQYCRERGDFHWEICFSVVTVGF